MKHLPTILFVSTAFGLCFLIGTLIIELRKESDLKQSTIDGLRKKNQVERDSLENVLKLTSDSLDIAFATIRQATIEREQAHARTQATIKNLQRIIFVTHNDSSRNAELKSLYKSYY